MNYPELYSEKRRSEYGDTPFLFLIVLMGATFGYALSCMLGGPASDEGFHAPQVWTYYSGGTTFSKSLTVPPTFHYILAFIAKQIGFYSDYLLRLINLCLSLCALPIFYAIAKRYYPYDAGMRMLQLFFTPLIFPYFFLIYTDTLSLLLVSLCIFLAIKRWYLLAAVSGLAAICLRQDAIIWIGLAYLFICFEDMHFYRPYDYKKFFANAFIRGFPFVVVFSLFIAFVIYNGGVAIGDKESHKMGQYNIANLHIFLLCAWVLFLPLNIQHLPEIIKWLKKPWSYAILVISFLVYMGTYSNNHGYNNSMFEFFLHNGLLYVLSNYMLIRVVLFIPVAWMVLTLCFMKLPEKRFSWLLLIIPISAISHPLVEPRYYFPAYMLINLLRPTISKNAEIATLGFYIVLAAFIMFGTVTGKFFL